MGNERESVATMAKSEEIKYLLFSLFILIVIWALKNPPFRWEPYANRICLLDYHRDFQVTYFRLQTSIFEDRLLLYKFNISRLVG